ncbi:MAG: hypothetical protein BGN82_10615 [Alphaproteobacteria bacterium 65-7]|nr:MAG: hypothetical protein BGN82_10615 [Alphaproteobacteria bacterium 65-7]
MSKRIAILAGAFLACAWGAAAQPEETVTVTGTREAERAAEEFVQSQGAATAMAGKMARWEVGVCPLTSGLAPRYATFISQRIRDVARAAGAPVAEAGCKPNMDIVFTTTPQGLLDNLRQKHRPYLGYHGSLRAADRLAKVTKPIQAWYVTATTDLNGKSKIDQMVQEFCDPFAPDCPLGVQVTGLRALDGIRSSLFHVTVVADPASLKDYEIGALADHIALLALSQGAPHEGCQALPSVSDLLSPGCAGATELSAADKAYLAGLYAMNPDMALSAQRGGVAQQVKKALAASGR